MAIQGQQPRARYEWKADQLEISMDDPAVTGNQPPPAMISQLAIKQGATLAVVVKWVDSLGTPIDLTGYTAKLELRDRPGGITYDTLTDTDGLTLGGSAGTITIGRTAAETAAYTFTRAVAGLELLSGSRTVTLCTIAVRLETEATI